MRVGICTPSGDGYPHHQYSFSVDAVRCQAGSKGIDLKQYVVAGNSILPFVRNHLVGKALADGCDYVFFWDDDIACDAKDFFKLIEWNVDIVAAAPAKRHKRWDEEPNSAFRLLSDGQVIEHKTKRGRLWEVPGLATAFMAIKATVFRDIEHLTQRYYTDGDEGEFQVRDWFWLALKQIDGRLMGQGEDYNFCDKWSAVGGELFLDPDVRLRHYDGNVCFDCCPADFETKQKEVVNG